MDVGLNYKQLVGAGLFLGNHLNYIFNYNDCYNYFYGIRAGIVIFRIQSVLFCYRRAVYIIFFSGLLNRKILFVCNNLYYQNLFLLLFKTLRKYFIVAFNLNNGGFLTNKLHVIFRKLRKGFPRCVVLANFDNSLILEVARVGIASVSLVDSEHNYLLPSHGVLSNNKNLSSVAVFLNLIKEGLLHARGVRGVQFFMSFFRRCRVCA